jgi:toxin ParE1/3/4
MIVVITGEAEDDLQSIGNWIARENPARALTFLREIRRCCEALIDAPRGYVLVPRYEHLGIRRRVYRDYVIFYRIVGDRIEVLHVLHGARDYESILFPER